ncbi:hypothetical protein [Pelagicoccus sp. SDUM812003]|uniref:DUF4139 domain-containing protein n=1 Tax=Pelagicoccus sp. SDUM812003 TaxID=3041267 RepID=UPI00280C4E94|nr:hypothetical protein [Pelagicoccus sp. SDUM812003]MDQ8204098.1 hypothetical protein [Pelagicoccus sp. SDUM812003]
MRTIDRSLLLASTFSASAFANPALTIYNDGFAVVRDSLAIDLERGVSTVTYSDATAHLEPQSVVIRDPQGSFDFTVLEQNYRADPLSQALLLSLFEGKTIEFERYRDDETEIVSGKIIRSGYIPHQNAYGQYGQDYRIRQQAIMGQGGGQPIIEVDGKLRFGLPGAPIFPSLGDDTILKPTLEWKIESPRSGKLDAQISYITQGMGWMADYNVIAPENSDTVDFVGWITMDNQTGRSFENAQIKLMAGDVNKVASDGYAGAVIGEIAMSREARSQPAVDQKSFDDFHLYTLQRPTTLRDRETKQVEFIHASGVNATRVYVYDGAFIPMNRYHGWNQESIRQDEAYGTESNPKVWIMQEIENSEENGLGIPLPKGKTRFYRQNEDDAQLEFTGENVIDHTPKNELLRINTGNAFDLVGERTRVRYNIDHRAHWVEEAFAIELSNRKEEPVTIRVVEHLYRWNNWEILESSHHYEIVDSDTIAFEAETPADGKTTLSYEVKYTW